jgi:hypothetical protein
MITLCDLLQNTSRERDELLDFSAAGMARDRSDCHFRKRATEYNRKPGIKWLSCAAK